MQDVVQFLTSFLPHYLFSSIAQVLLFAIVFVVIANILRKIFNQRRKDSANYHPDAGYSGNNLSTGYSDLGSHSSGHHHSGGSFDGGGGHSAGGGAGGDFGGGGGDSGGGGGDSGGGGH